MKSIGGIKKSIISRLRRAGVMHGAMRQSLEFSIEFDQPQTKVVLVVPTNRSWEGSRSYVLCLTGFDEKDRVIEQQKEGRWGWSDSLNSRYVYLAGDGSSSPYVWRGVDGASRLDLSIVAWEESAAAPGAIFSAVAYSQECSSDRLESWGVETPKKQVKSPASIFVRLFHG